MINRKHRFWDPPESMLSLRVETGGGFGYFYSKKEAEDDKLTD